TMQVLTDEAKRMIEFGPLHEGLTAASSGNTIPQYAEKLIQEGTRESLHDAELLSFGNIQMLDRISEVLRVQEPKFEITRTFEWNSYQRRKNAEMLACQGRIAEAGALLRRNLEDARSLVPPKPLAVASALQQLTSNLLDQGKPFEAEPLARECLAAYQKHV